MLFVKTLFRQASIKRNSETDTDHRLSKTSFDNEVELWRGRIITRSPPQETGHLTMILFSTKLGIYIHNRVIYGLLCWYQDIWRLCGIPKLAWNL